MISIIIPVYNVEKYLKKCVNSIINQTYTDFELILVDDGSTDNSGKICDEYSKKDSRVIVIHQRNQGTAVARNTGLDLVHGEYIIFIDADDYIESDCLRILTNSIKDTDCECCICGYQVIDESYNLKEKVFFENSFTISGVEAIKERYISEDIRINIINPWGKIFKREVWEDLRFTSGLYYEDLDIMPYLYLNIDKVKFIYNIGYNYMIRENSSSHGSGKDDKRIIDSVLIREKHIKLFESVNENKLVNYNIKSLMDLLITSSYKNWIPKEMEKVYKTKFKEYLKKIILKKGFSAKDKIKYTIFFFKRVFLK